MDQDNSLLAKISSKFTEDTLKNILSKVTGKETVRVLGWKFERGSGQGDNYSGLIYRLTVDGVVDNKKTQVKVIAKTLSKNEVALQWFGSKGFPNEFNFYTKVVPQLEKFLASKKQEEIILPVARCLEAYCDGINDFLVLEDLRELGYTHSPRQHALDLKDIQVVLKSLARLHATAYAYKDQHPLEFTKTAETLSETYFRDSQWNWYEKFLSSVFIAAKDALSKEYKNTPEEKHFAKIQPWELFKQTFPFGHNPATPTSTISQGDSWHANVMLRENNSSSREKQAILLDFEMARCASPVLDISYFIYTSTNKKILDEHYDNLLKYYHDQLSKYITLLGSDPTKIYPWNLFMQEVKEKSVAGFCIALDGLPLLMLEESEAIMKDNITGSEGGNIEDIMKVEPIKDQEKRKRFADMIVHAIRQGFI